MRFLYSFILLYCAFLPLSTMAQNNQNSQKNQQYIDQNGYTYYIDANGYPYYIDRDGYAYYLDQNGVPYYIDNNGNPFYLDENKQPYYVDKDGYIYHLDEKGIPFYTDNNGQIYYLDNNGRPYYPKSQSKIYNDDIYPKTTRNAYRTNRTETIRQSNTQTSFAPTEFDKFRIAAGGGYSFRLGERQKSYYPEIDQASKDLMHGFNIDGDIQYFFKEDIGIGITSNYLKTSTSLYKTKQTFWYVGPSFVTKSDLKNSFSFIFNIGIGPLFFKESSNTDSDYTKTTVAINTGISGEYRITKNLGIGLKISGTYGTIGSINYGGSSYDLDERQNVSNFSITGFISFRSK